MVMRTINVSGVKFEFNDKLLLNYPGQTLAKLCEDVQQGSNPNDDAAGCTEIVVERPAEGFAAVLAFYQTGELHMPVSMCPRAFRRELQFWNVNAADLQQCCAFKSVFIKLLRIILIWPKGRVWRLNTTLTTKSFHGGLFT